MNPAEKKKWFDSAEFEAQFHTDEPLGALCAEGGTSFALWAPTAQEVALNLYDHGHEGEPKGRFSMCRGERGVWTAAFKENLDGVYYDFDVTVDGAAYRTGDPYARACGVNGWRSMVIDLSRTNPQGWESDRAPARQAEDIIYELHVKDFTWDVSSGVPEQYRGKYKALCEADAVLGSHGKRKTGVGYLRDLGVTHVQLMPVYDYGSVDEAGDPDAFNWGYDPVNYNVPEGSYATDPWHGEVRIRELKEAVQALHANGFRVIMDVVYNHTYNLESPLFKTVPWYFYRQTEDGKAANGSGCGNEIASERSMCARYIVDSVLYWAREYHMDGFRFDLMGILDVALMNRIQRELDAAFGRGEKLVYGEPWSAGACSQRQGTVLADKGHLRELDDAVAAFCDATRDAVKGGLGDRAERGFVNGGAFNAQWLACCMRGWAGEGANEVKAPSQTISYLSCHDDWTLWDKLVCSMEGGRSFKPLSPDVLRANRLAAAMLFCCQGHLFMLSGEEFGRTKRGVKNSFRTTLLINRVDWKRAWENRALVDYYRGLIALRKQLPGLCDKSRQAGKRILSAAEPVSGCAVIRVDNAGEGSAWPELTAIFNTRTDAVQIDLPEGVWQPLCDGENSFLWQQSGTAEKNVCVPGVSALILGRRV